MAFGDEIMQGVMNAADTVTKAVETGDFSNLSSDITASINDTAQRLKEQTFRSNGFGSNASKTSQSPHSGTNMTEQYLLNKKKTSAFQKNNVSKFTGVVSSFLAGANTIFFGLITLVVIPLVIADFSAGGIAVWIMFAAITALFGLWWKKSHDNKKLASKFNLFKKAAANREYISVKEFANYVQMPEEDFKNTIKKMINKGMLLGARFDATETTLMLSENAYEEYQKFLESQRQQEFDSKNAQASEGEEGDLSDVQRVISEGNEYLVNVRKINDMIPDDDAEHMSDKLYSLENIMKRIFEYVEQHPDKAQDLRKFMNYYLPTTQKLLNAYVQLDAQPEVGDNIKDTKRQISDALNTINSAFEKLFDDLFEEQAWDIASDISVMQTMMSQDGLTQSQTGF